MNPKQAIEARWLAELRKAGETIARLNRRCQTAEAAAACAPLRALAQSLVNEVKGLLGIADEAIRETVGNTNLACLREKLAELDEALRR